MANTTDTSQPFNLGKVVVIGGCGFLGHHIVSRLLLPLYTAQVSVIDISTARNRRPDSDGVRYYDGDITSLEDSIVAHKAPGSQVSTEKKVRGLIPLFEQIRPDVVIHTASPNALSQGGSNDTLYKRVNIDGTKCVIEACQRTGVKALVYTSSASIISDNSATYDLINADERWPVVPEALQTEYYSWTKAVAEAAVLAANRSSTQPSFLTCALRPAGIFGPGDVQALPPILRLYTSTPRRTNWQIGMNTNLFDFTYVENVAHAHCLAAVALLTTASMFPGGGTGVSSSGLSTSSAPMPLDHERVDGEVFLITNDSPTPFWDFARAIWAAAGETRGTEHVWVMGRDVGMAIGTLLEYTLGLLGRKPNLTTKQVKYACMTRYYNIGKAKSRLGYQPVVELGEGIRRGVAWAMKQDAIQEEKQ